VSPRIIEVPIFQRKGRYKCNVRHKNSYDTGSK
jgi:hypothetical protein